MRTLSWMLMLSVVMSSSGLAETIVDGVVYPEITELNQVRTARVQPQTAQVPQFRTASYPRSTTLQPADVRPVLGGSLPTVQTAVATPYAYGHGYTSVGAPQKVVQVIQPIGYTNTVPQQQITYVQPVAYAQPVTNIQPLTNVQTLSATPYNPYVQTKGVPWRPIVSIRSMPDNYVVGQGIIGQPKVYVPSQPVRNFIRYITP